MHMFPKERRKEKSNAINMQRHLYACRVKRMQKEIKSYIFAAATSHEVCVRSHHLHNVLMRHY